MFGLKRKNKNRYRQTTSQVLSIQRQVFHQLHPEFVKKFGHIEGARLAQEVVDKLFGRCVPRNGHDLMQANASASEIARQDKNVRDAAFISLRAMLEVEGANNNFSAERRIIDTIDWLKQFGEIPADASQPEALVRISNAFKNVN